MEDSNFIADKDRNSYNYNECDGILKEARETLKKAREIRTRRLGIDSSDESSVSSHESWRKFKSHRPPEPKRIQKLDRRRRSESAREDRIMRSKHTESGRNYRKDKSKEIEKTTYFEALERERRYPYFVDEIREKERLRKKYGSAYIDSKSSKTEKVPYFKDEAREKDRLREKYKKQSLSKLKKDVRRSRSRSLRRRSPFSRSRSRSRSKSRHRRSSTERVQIIPYPVPVPEYSLGFPPFLPQRDWPGISMPFHGPNMMPYYSRQHYRNSRMIPNNNRIPPSHLPPPPPPMGAYMPPFPMNGMMNYGPSAPMRPLPPNMTNRYRFQN